jgi:RimJ/RimL family protein N-acetyltransferase
LGNRGFFEKVRPQRAAHTGFAMRTIETARVYLRPFSSNDPENVASQWAIQKIGFRYVKDARFYNSGVEYYAITRQEFEQDDSP